MTIPVTEAELNALQGLVGTRYRPLALLGKKSGRKTLLAEELETNAKVVIKLLTFGEDFSWDDLKLFEREAETLRSLEHSAIPQYLDYFEVETPRSKGFALVQSYIEARSLAEQIKAGRRFSEEELEEIAQQLLEILEYLHSRQPAVIHRDIKPSNILVTPDASLGELTKILDFGIATLIEGDQNQPKGFMGTMPYSAPEQMEGQEPTSQSDIYSLGVLIFRSLTGELPIQAAHPNFGSWYKAQSNDPPRDISEVAPQLQLPQDLVTLIYSCLDKKPENRPANMAEILESLGLIEEQLGADESSQRTQLQASTLQLDAAKEIQRSPSIDEICLRQTWPKGKPIAQLVFPQRLKTNQGNQLTLWVMLPDAEIQQLSLGRLYTQVYRNCLCTMTPHPMLMWITALHSRFFRDGQDARWLPCFLDLKSQQGQLFARLLAAQGEYRILFFTLEHPHRCAHVIQTKLSAKQCSQLGQWIIESQTRHPLGEPGQSKQKLKHELTRLKAETTF